MQPLFLPFHTNTSVAENSVSFPSTHSEVMRDGAAHLTLCLNGLLTFDLSGEVGLRWKGLPEKASRGLLTGIWVFVLLRLFILFFFSP